VVDLPERQARELRGAQRVQGKSVALLSSTHFLTAMRSAVDVFKVQVFLDYEGNLSLK
jgi:hypothetical protein